MWGCTGGMLSEAIPMWGGSRNLSKRAARGPGGLPRTSLELFLGKRLRKKQEKLRATGRSRRSPVRLLLLLFYITFFFQNISNFVALARFLRRRAEEMGDAKKNQDEAN
eukprot:GHVT01095481.1.p1 GENE.GHVT01095481.1~~GHVT01095481.1.p1  ORF type:complete len:109 (-),score=9.72 GHVT01095481.1:311-637(-)